MRVFRLFRRKKSDKILKIVEKAHLFKRYIFLLIGVLMYALAYNLFFFKNNIVYGGARSFNYDSYIKCTIFSIKLFSFGERKDH